MRPASFGAAARIAAYVCIALVALVGLSASPWKGDPTPEPLPAREEPTAKPVKSETAIERLTKGDSETEELREQVSRELEQRRRDFVPPTPEYGPTVKPSRPSQSSREMLEQRQRERRAESAGNNRK